MNSSKNTHLRIMEPLQCTNVPSGKLVQGMGEDKNVVRLGGLADWKEPNSSPSGAPSEDLSFVKGEGELE